MHLHATSTVTTMRTSKSILRILSILVVVVCGSGGILTAVVLINGAIKYRKII